MSAPSETERARRYHTTERELVYRAWRECGGNLAATLRLLEREHDWPLAKQTLADWRDQYGWEARRAAEEADAARRVRAEALDRSTMLAGLDLQIEAYESAFSQSRAAGEVPDSRAVGAYASLLRLRLSTLRDIESGAGLSKLDLAMECLRTVSDLVRADYPQHAAAWLEVLEPAGQRMAELYG